MKIELWFDIIVSVVCVFLGLYLLYQVLKGD